VNVQFQIPMAASESRLCWLRARIVRKNSRAYSPDGGPTNTPAKEAVVPVSGGGAGPKTAKKRFYGTIALDTLKDMLSLAQVVDEVVRQFTTKHNVAVKISVEIEAVIPAGFDDTTLRAVRENCNVL